MAKAQAGNVGLGARQGIKPFQSFCWQVRVKFAAQPIGQPRRDRLEHGAILRPEQGIAQSLLHMGVAPAAGLAE